MLNSSDILQGGKLSLSSCYPGKMKRYLPLSYRFTGTNPNRKLFISALYAIPWGEGWAAQNEDKVWDLWKLLSGNGTENLVSSCGLGQHQPQRETLLIYPLESRAAEPDPAKRMAHCTHPESALSPQERNIAGGSGRDWGFSFEAEAIFPSVSAL